jgi:hypothetical protein
MRACPLKRRLEDRIRELCTAAAESKNGNFQKLMAELHTALSEHALRVHNKTTATVLAWPNFPRDRRRAS